MKLVKYPDEILKTPSRPVEEGEYGEIAKLAEQAKKIMIKDRGCGLAANQVGDNRRWFVWECGSVVINPRILRGFERKTSKEGCLSWEDPQRLFRKSRYSRIQAAWTTRDGEPRYQILLGKAAIIFQHELDHLDGKNVWDGQAK